MENLDLREILKDVPRGTRLYSTTHGDICFDCVDYDDNVYPIKCYEHCLNYVFTKEGKYHYNYNGECVLFPSKEQKDWRKFIAKPFQNGDVVTTNVGNIAIFSHYSSTDAIVYHCVITNNKIKINQSTGIGYHHNCHLASKEEEEKLYNLLQKEEYFWNAKTNSLEKYKFKVGDVIQNIKTKNKYTIFEIKHDFYYISTDKKYNAELCCVYQNELELCQEKFDITTLKPYDKVLVRFGNNSIWEPQLFSRLDTNLKNHVDKFVVIGFFSVPQCIPYEGNEHLVGTTNDCKEYYKTWE